MSFKGYKTVKAAAKSLVRKPDQIEKQIAKLQTQMEQAKRAVMNKCSSAVQKASRAGKLLGGDESKALSICHRSGIVPVSDGLNLIPAKKIGGSKLKRARKFLGRKRNARRLARK